MREQTVTTKRLGELLDLTGRRIRQLTDQGLFERTRDPEGRERPNSYPLRASINSYVRFLRNNHQLDPEEHDYQKSSGGNPGA